MKYGAETWARELAHFENEGVSESMIQSNAYQFLSAEDYHKGVCTETPAAGFWATGGIGVNSGSHGAAECLAALILIFLILDKSADHIRKFACSKTLHSPR